MAEASKPPLLMLLDVGCCCFDLRSVQADARKGGEYTRIRLQFDDADTAPEPQTVG